MFRMLCHIETTLQYSSTFGIDYSGINFKLNSYIYLLVRSQELAAGEVAGGGSGGAASPDDCRGTAMG